MAYVEKIAQATALLEEHNRQISEGEEGRVNIESFIKKLKAEGGTTEGALTECSWEILQDCGLPKILAKKIAVTFRTVPETGEKRTKHISDHQVMKLDVRGLLEHYDPSPLTGSAHVTNRLKALVGEQPVILLNPDGTVNVDVSVQLVKDAVSGLPGRTSYDVEGRPQLLYVVGQQPPSQAEENPIFAGLPLRSDGTCSKTELSWKDVPHVVRQLVYVIFNGTKDRLANDESAYSVLDLINSDVAGAEKKLRLRYRQASLLLDQLERMGAAPTLRISLTALGSTDAAKPKNDPFYASKGHKRY